ncbi:MAG: HEAT repeat domain-containing protein, partial [Myxococcales bacterium]
MEKEQDRPRERLCDPDPEVRYRAVMELDRADIGSLLSRLSDENWRVRKAAVERLANLPDPSEVIGALIERLWDADDAGARNSAAEALARIGGPAIPPLAACLRVEDCDVRKLAADVLGDIRDPAASPALVAALGDADQNVRVAAAEALGKVGGAEAAGALEAILGSADGLLQLAALNALARIGRAPPIGVLAPLARERFLKRSVLRLLGWTPGRASLEIVAESLKESARGTREEAFAALASQLELGHEKPQAITQTLLAALKHPARLAQLAREALDASGPRAVAGAMRVLGMVGEPSDAPAIAAAARGEVLRDAAVTALQAMGVGAGPALVKVLPDLQPEARLVAIEALARLRERSALSALVEVAEEGTEPERLLAVEALGALGDSGAIEALFALVEEGELAAPAAEALAALGKA